MIVFVFVFVFFKKNKKKKKKNWFSNHLVLLTRSTLNLLIFILFYFIFYRVTINGGNIMENSTTLE